MLITNGATVVNMIERLIFGKWLNMWNKLQQNRTYGPLQRHIIHFGGCPGTFWCQISPFVLLWTIYSICHHTSQYMLHWDVWHSVLVLWKYFYGHINIWQPEILLFLSVYSYKIVATSSANTFSTLIHEGGKTAKNRRFSGKNILSYCTREWNGRINEDPFLYLTNLRQFFRIRLLSSAPPHGGLHSPSGVSLLWHSRHSVYRALSGIGNTVDPHYSLGSYVSNCQLRQCRTGSIAVVCEHWAGMCESKYWVNVMWCCVPADWKPPNICP